MLLGADQGGHRHAVLLAHLDHGLWRHAQRIRDQADRMPERGVEHLERALAIEGLRLVVGDARRRQFDAVLVQEVAGEGAMFAGNPRLQAFPGDVLLARCRDIFGDQHVEPIRLAIDVIIDPFQFLLDGFGRMAGSAKHPETAGAADRGYHVAAMAKREQRKFNSQHVADRRFHGGVHSRAAVSWPARTLFEFYEFSDDANPSRAVVPSTRCRYRYDRRYTRTRMIQYS